MANPLRSNDASPFIKRDQMRREFLKARQRSNAPRPVVKKEDPEVAEEEARRLLAPETVAGRVKKEPGTSGYSEYPLRAVDLREVENVKTHLIKFQAKKKIDPVNDFHHPIRLHRKDTRNLQFQLTRAEIVQRQKEIAEYKRRVQEEKEGGSTPTDTSAVHVQPQGNTKVNSSNSSVSTPLSTTKEEPTDSTLMTTKAEVVSSGTENSSQVGMVKYDGNAETETHEEGTIDPMADVAPDGGGRFRRGNLKRKTRQLKPLDEEAKKLRFEEFYPWVMEDFDGFNTWVGSYEAGNSDSYVLLSVENDGSFTMIPAEKTYRFTARNKYTTLTIDEAEKRMEKNREGAPRWFMKHLDESSKTTTRYDRTMRRLKAVDGRTGNNNDDEDEDRTDNSEVELDYDEKFDDDEEAPIIDGNEEENKESEKRIKKEMLQANAMGLRDDENEDDTDDLFGEKKIDEEGEKVKKALMKTDLGALYESDEEQNPYLSQSEEEEIQEDKEKKDSANDSDRKSRKSSPKKKSESPNVLPKLSVKSIDRSIITLHGDKAVLSNFPIGTWNPNATKLTSETVGIQNAENRPSMEYSDEDLLTEQEIIDAIDQKQLTLKQLIRQLKEKVNKHPDNKERMKVFVKKLVKLNGKYLELSK